MLKYGYELLQPNATEKCAEDVFNVCLGRQEK